MKASGQCLNRQKSSIFFNANTKQETRSQLLNMSGLSICRNQEKCLSLPSYMDKSKYGTFEAIKDRVWKRINSQKNIYLSQEEKEFMLKLEVQHIPIYAISVFQLPRKLCKDIASYMSRFGAVMIRKIEEFSEGNGRSWGFQS